MSTKADNPNENNNLQKETYRRAADALFNYLRDVIYDSSGASLNIEELPEDFRDFGHGLRYFAECVIEAKTLASALARGELAGYAPSHGNEIAAPLKSLHASLRHMTWQTQQVAKGDYQQRVKFMGDFAVAFNSMAQQLEERKKSETLERSKLQRYINLILSNIPNVLLVFDIKGKAVLASEVFGQSAAMPYDDIEGKTFRQLFSRIMPEEFLFTMDIYISDAAGSGQTVSFEQDIDFLQNGNPSTYIIHIAPMIGEEGDVIGTLILLSDITETINAKHEAERAREHAEQSAKAKSDFLARMSHEMRTPMNAIIGMSTIGISAGDSDKKNYSLKKIKDASTHLLGVINDVLDMSKIEAEKIELSSDEFNIESMLSNVKSIIGYQASQKHHNLSFEVDSRIPEFIISDEQRLAQVLTNLLTNAVKFTPDNGSVKLTVKDISDSEDLRTILFSVSDTGIGIPKDKQKKLFDPFEQADGSISREFGGTGLGLAISKSIVEMMGGSLHVESETGRGSCFTFDIKVLKGTGSVKSEKPKDQSRAGIFAGKKVLIAEDVEINREIISILLEETELDITFAHDGEQAIQAYRSSPDSFGLILMDIQMPRMDGYEATKIIRASGLPGCECIPIIAMTANVFKDDVDRCYAAGMNGHLGKPVDINEVISKLSEYLL